MHFTYDARVTLLGKNIENPCLRLTKYVTYTVKKGYRFSRPRPGCHLSNSPWPRIIKLFPATESLECTVTATFYYPYHGPRTEQRILVTRWRNVALLWILGEYVVLLAYPYFVSLNKIIIYVCKEIVNGPFRSSSINYKIFTTKKLIESVHSARLFGKTSR